MYYSRDDLEGLRAYKYKSSGTTWLDDAHQPFWNGMWIILGLTVSPQRRDGRGDDPC